MIDSAETPFHDGLNELAALSFDSREPAAGARQSRAMLHPQSIQLAHVLSAEILKQVPAHQLLAERDDNPRLDLLAADGQAFVQVPRDRASKHASRSRQYMKYPPPHSAHFVRPEKRYFGRRA